MQLGRKHLVYFCFVISWWVVAGTAATALGQPVEQLTINYIESAPVPDQFVNQVGAYFTVSAGDQKPVLGLKTSNFKVLEDGREIQNVQVDKTDEPMAVVLAIDTSGSMLAKDRSGQTSMSAARNAAVNFISMLDKTDRVALFSFNTEPTFQLDFTSDHAAAVKAVKALRAKVNAATCLYDTAYEAVKKAAEIPRGRRAIILLTDGKDERAGRLCSTHNVNDVIDAATTKTIRVPIYTIGVGPKVDAKELSRIASFTGGRSLLAASIEELDGFYQTLASQLKNQYVLKYNTQTPSGEHSLVIKVSDNGHMAQDEKRFWAPPLPVLPPPTIEIVGPKPTGREKDAVTVKIRITPEKTIAKVRFYEDAALKKEFNAKPFDTFSWEIAKLSAGLHVLRVEAVDIKGQSGVAELTLKVAGPPATQPAAQPLKPMPAEKEEAAGTGRLLWLVSGIVLLGIVVCLLLSRRFFGTKKSENHLAEAIDKPAEPFGAVDVEEDDDEDATIFIPEPDEQDLSRPAAASQAPLASVSVVKSRQLDPKKVFDVSGAQTIGRSDTNDIHIPDKAVSRKHAEIYVDGNTYYVRDLGSKYGTKVNGQGVGAGREALKDGDQIELGPQTVLQFNILIPFEDEGEDEDDMTRRFEEDDDEKTLVAD